MILLNYLKGKILDYEHLFSVLNTGNISIYSCAWFKMYKTFEIIPVQLVQFYSFWDLHKKIWISGKRDNLKIINLNLCSYKENILAYMKFMLNYDMEWPGFWITTDQSIMKDHSFYLI